jgi:hypothetical protein
VPDREDLLHTIIANLADAGRNNGHKHTNGLTCGNCSSKQRRRCKEEWLYGKCPKLVKIESLNKPIIDSEGHTTELGELIADDKALDLDAWLDYKTFLLTSPERLLIIGEKIRNGTALTKAEHSYLERFRKREQKKLFRAGNFSPFPQII